jgi:ATP-dependent DNA helicase RecG
MLKGKHNSQPANPLIARAMYLYGSIEQVGTGTEMLVEQCLKQGLREPEFEQSQDFTVTFWRKENLEDNTVNAPVNTQVNTQVSTQVSTQVEKLVSIFNDEVSTINDLMKIMQLKERRTFARNYIQPALKAGLIEMTIPDKPNSRLQKYRLTPLGLNIKKLNR